MKINGPVDCTGIFRDQIQQNQKGVWCVTLSPNGQIQALIETHFQSRDPWLKQLHLVREHLKKSSAKQWIMVRITDGSTLFSPWDWLLIDQMKKLSSLEEIDFCDYVKINGQDTTHLLQWDY